MGFLRKVIGFSDPASGKDATSFLGTSSSGLGMFQDPAAGLSGPGKGFLWFPAQTAAPISAPAATTVDQLFLYTVQFLIYHFYEDHFLLIL